MIVCVSILRHKNEPITNEISECLEKNLNIPTISPNRFELPSSVARHATNFPKF